MRKTKDVVIPPGLGEDRDLGKTFRITEMPAFQAERWATRATLALAPRLSKEVTPEVAEQLQDRPSMAPMGRLFAILGGVKFPELDPLMDELVNDGSPGKPVSCVQIITDPRLPPRAIGMAGSVEDIEEAETISYLRQEVLQLHTGFTLPAAILGLIAVVERLFSETMKTYQSSLGS